MELKCKEDESKGSYINRKSKYNALSASFKNETAYRNRVSWETAIENSDPGLHLGSFWRIIGAQISGCEAF